MPKNIKQRSVGVQNTESYTSESRAQPARLVKKAAFRNLLRKSVTIVPRDYEQESEVSYLPAERNSKSIQATLDRELSLQRFKPSKQKSQIFQPRIHTPGRHNASRTNFLETIKGEEQRTRTSNPGTSKMMSVGLSSTSIASQMNEIHFNYSERTSAIIYDYDEKVVRSSIPSSLGFFYGSQRSRRFSDETVLLIEDYQSYDSTNAARRRDVDLNRRRNFFFCCRRNPRVSVEILTRPLPLYTEDILEKDEIVCRICHEGEDVEPLIQPCLCKGSIGSVHAKCLKNWLEQSNTSRCELCNYPYAIQQTKKYSKCVSVKVFYKTVVDRRAMAYDVISFVIITPLTLVGVVMCIQASVFSATGGGGSNHQMGYITKAGMIMLSGTIVVAYGVWLYTLISYHYKSWKKWYNNCYDVEVLPVRMTSEERVEAARRLSVEMNRRQFSREQNSALVTLVQSPRNYNHYQRRVSMAHLPPAFHRDR